MSLRDVFTENLRFYRKKLNLSQQELAEKCAIATNYVSEIERGQKFPSVEMIERLAAELGIPPYALFVGANEKANTELIEKRTNSKFAERLMTEVSRLLSEYGFLER